jgi:hypothetical protein
VLSSLPNITPATTRKAPEQSLQIMMEQNDKEKEK